MTRLGFALVALVGCGAKPAEPLPPVPAPLAPNELPLSRPPHVGPIHSVRGNEPTAPDSQQELGPAMFPRPVIETPIDPPDIAELGRWPLTVAEHPALEPHFDIAGALADAGVTWTDLCARGAQNRHLAANQELVAYLDAWCSVISADYSAAIVKLGLVRHAPNRRVVEALKLDVAAIVAAHGPAHDLESFLRAGGFLDTEQVDLVSAAYFEVGKLDDAAEANDLAAVMDATPTEKMRCSRMLRSIADAANGNAGDAIASLKRLAFPPPNDIRTPRCRSQYHMVTCWKDHDCGDYWDGFATPSAPLGGRRLARTYQHWNRNRTGYDWYLASSELTGARPFRDRYTLLVIALDLALRGSSCTQSSLSDIADVAKLGLDDLARPRPTVAMAADERLAEDDRLAQLATLSPAEIKRFRVRLEATRAAAQGFLPLTVAACAKAQAALGPVQP